MNALSPYLLTILISWFAAQTLKYVVFSFKHRSFKKGIGQLYLSGNMPSAHSAAVAAMVTIIGLKNGIGSGLFGLALLFAVIVMYDAVKVRRSSGEQGAVILKLIKETNSKIKLPRVAKGHTPTEVALGVLLGVAIGAVVFLSTM